MCAMGALQPGLPNPAMIPEGWKLLIVDLKDCFFTIALHDNDKQRFAFTLPAINREGPYQRFEWTVLPQGMRNSPTLCQLYVDAALQSIRRAWPKTIIYHYMDDILLAQEEIFSLQQKNALAAALKQMGLVIAPEKIQETSPWKYLGWKITDSTIQPQKLTIQSNITTLNDAQKLLGDLQWIRPVVGIPNELLNSLRPLLKGTDPAAKVTLSEQQSEILQQIASLITTRVTHRRIPDRPLDFTVLCGPQYLMGAITQQKIKTGEKEMETVVLEWTAPPLQPRRTIQEKIDTLSELIKKGRNRILQIDGVPPSTIWLPIKPGDLEWYIQNSEKLQAALLQDGATIVAKTLQSTILSWMENQAWITQPKRSDSPLADAVTVFTDAGKRSKSAAITWKDEQGWQHQILKGQDNDSLQTLELYAVVWTFIKWKDAPLNVVSDSLYVVGIANRIEDSALRDVKNERLAELLTSLQLAIAQRSKSYAVIHIRSHQWMEGLGEGNARADKLVAAPATEAPLSPFCRAREAHAIFHQNAKGLARAYKLSRADAQAIVKACPICSNYNSGVGLGVGTNPRGLKANEVWQMDVTHVPAFGRLKYLHVTIDTYSHMIWATPQPGEKVRDVRRHLASCFAVMGVPQTIKTDNGPAYVSGPFKRFMELWDIKHITGIPHSPTGQAIVERANGTVKQYLEKFKDIIDVRERVDKTLFVLNHLCVFGEHDEPPAARHYTKSENDNKCAMRVLYRDMKTGQWLGPADVIYVGRGYVCVSSPTGPTWVPSRCVKPAIKKEEDDNDHG
uniref:Uncharacterized protein n=1 Tax=Anas zonorhyncha TaxID=75864 RepID=A0A8B9U0M2_9AVES